MMTDYSQHPYKNLLDHIESGCQQINESRDFVEYLLSMEQAESIDELTKILNNVIKLLAVIFYGRKILPNDWYLYDCWGRVPANHVRELFNFYNDNILLWYKRQENPTIEQCTSCIVNLRHSSNTTIIQDEILELAGDNKAENIDFKINVRDGHYETRIKIDKAGLYSHNYLKIYKSRSMILGNCGHIFDSIEIAFGKKYDLNYDNLIADFKNIVEQEQKEEEERLKKERSALIVGLIIGIPTFLVALYIIFLIFDAIGGFFGLIVIIGLFGLIPKVILTGKI